MKPGSLESLVNEDRISQIPEALIVHILCLLPTKEVVATSVLSKQWRHVWKMVPKLKFDDDIMESEDETFSGIVSRVLLSHKAPVLDSLDFGFHTGECDDMDIEKWIGIAYAMHLRELKLIVDSGNEWTFKFPSSLYNCETLETLKLKYWVLIDVSSPVCFKSLRTLQLKHVDYKDDASVVNLLSGCPNLETLTVHRCERDVKIFTIASPSLQRLTIYDEYNWYNAQDIGGYVINAPSLIFLQIGGFWGHQFRLIAPKLIEANISKVHIKMDEKTLGSLISVKRLSLTDSPLEITFPTGTIFYRLIYFELSTHIHEWWKLLLFMLDTSPKLQVLKLISKTNGLKKDVACEKWNQCKDVSLMRHLETFQWNGYKKRVEEEKEVVKYILRNANHLKRATCAIKGIKSDRRLELLEELESVISASNSSCKLLLFSK